jgi:teichuronic acid biosynthesis glycosyltransferase TuaH
MSHHFIKNRDIIMFSFQPWDTEIGSNFKDMAAELAKNNRILFVNRALDRRSKKRDKNDPKVHTRLASIKDGTGELTEIMPNLWVFNPRIMVESINWIPSAFVHDKLNRINNKRIAAEINRAALLLQFKDALLINDNDFIRGFYLKEFINCTHYIFYIRDYMLAVDFFKRHGSRLEPGLMRKCDMVVANSAYLANYAKQYNKNSFDIGQGCELAPFLITNPPLPAGLENIPKPIIGYAGFISQVRLDDAVLQHLAKNFPQCSIVLVGPVDEYFQKSELNKYSNVYMPGRKPPQSLPQYIYHFDICINPQAVNPVTIGNYPRKIDEYLAMQKPVVATKTEAMEMFAPYTFLCNSKEAYANIINTLLKDENLNNNEEKNKRRAFALQHTWQNSIGRLGDAYAGLFT